MFENFEQKKIMQKESKSNFPVSEKLGAFRMTNFAWTTSSVVKDDVDDNDNDDINDNDGINDINSHGNGSFFVVGQVKEEEQQHPTTVFVVTRQKFPTKNFNQFLNETSSDRK